MASAGIKTTEKEKARKRDKWKSLEENGKENAATVDDEFGKGWWASATFPGTKMQQL